MNQYCFFNIHKKFRLTIDKTNKKQIQCFLLSLHQTLFPYE